MPKCPSCGEDIDKLLVARSISASLSIDTELNNATVWDDEEICDDDYYCPKCESVLFCMGQTVDGKSYQERAILFLKGVNNDKVR